MEEIGPVGDSVTRKILAEHLVSGELSAGSPIGVAVDQVLTQDATGTMAYLQFEAMEIPRIQVETAVSYVDHNMLQTSFRNPDDHRFLESAAARWGAYFSRPGNGICHQVQLERFAAPGKILVGSDSHTPTAGGIGQIAIGTGGLDVATVMAGHPFQLAMPKVVRVRLEGELDRPWVMAMDVILELLRRLTVKGGVGKIMEYAGPGVTTLTVTERATITNMGAELGATTSIFPSDEATRHFLAAQGREAVWRPLEADPDAVYDEEIIVDLSALEPMVAKPHSPDNVVPARVVAGTPLAQVCVGSCTNSSYQALKQVASVLRGREIAAGVSMTVSPGSKQAFEMIAREGDLADMVAAGARVLESGCGPCIGMGQSPPSRSASLRSFNRNFKGRSGTPDAEIYLANPLVCAASAVSGHIVDPRAAGFPGPAVSAEPDVFAVDDKMIVPPPEDGAQVVVLRGPNIKEVPVKEPLEDRLELSVLLKVGDDITTDHIMPASADILPLRSNIPAISEYVFSGLDPTFARRAVEARGGAVVGGRNYGQGSSREHAALAPMYLGVRAVIAKSFARIHRANLINFGLLPLEFVDESDYDRIEQGATIELEDVLSGLDAGRFEARLREVDTVVGLRLEVSDREREILRLGGLLAWVRESHRRREAQG
jgi:aconitate hydratase